MIIYYFDKESHLHTGALNTECRIYCYEDFLLRKNEYARTEKSFSGNWGDCKYCKYALPFCFKCRHYKENGHEPNHDDPDFWERKNESDS